jgi:tRNA threonylcarbamoyladenosine biosynthesis protein TsaB
MSLILCIETATAACSVSLLRNGEPFLVKQTDKKNAHSTVLNLFIEQLMTEGEFQYSDLDAVAVSKGPGSYTGLRIGVSTAKGLGYALDIPVMAPETLLCMASGFVSSVPDLPDDALICPMIDARRMEVFTAVYDIHLNPLKPIAAIIIDDSAFSELPAGRPLYFFGDGAEKCAETLSRQKNRHFYPGFINSANHMAGLVTTYYNESRFEDLAYFEPFYLKDFIAGAPKVKGLRP